MPSVALVVLDTLRQDAFERAFDWLPGRRFTHTYSTAHWTVPAHASLLTGQYASEVGVHGKAPALDCPEPVLPEQLQDAGYHTRCFTANPQMVQYDGWDRGFDEFVGYQSLGCYEADMLDWGETIASLQGSALRRYLQAFSQCVRGDCATIKSLRQGYDLFTRHDVDGGAAETRDRIRATDFGDDEFCFVNLMETHTPYYPPDDGEPLLVLAAEAIAGEPIDVDRVRRAYAASVDYLAETYRDIYADLAADFDYVITVSDHGELLGEHDLVNHSYGLYPELVRVPLVVSGPASDDPSTSLDGVDDTVTSILDVHRTVAVLAGIDDVDSRGQHLLREREPRDYGFEYHGLLSFPEAQFDRHGVPDDEYERRDVPLDGVVTPDGTVVYETHTDGLRVRREGRTVPAERGENGPDRLEDPAGRIEAFVDSLDRRPIEGDVGHHSDAVRDRLEALGYA